MDLSLRPAQSALASPGTASYKVRLHLKPLKKKKRKEEGEEKEEEEGHKMKRRKEEEEEERYSSVKLCDLLTNPKVIMGVKELKCLFSKVTLIVVQ